MTFKGMLNQRPNSDGDPVLPIKRTYTHTRQKHITTSTHINTSTFHAYINLFNLVSLILKLSVHF